MENQEVISFLKELRESSDSIYKIFTEGSCFRLYCILKTVYPRARAYWSDRENHCVILIDNCFYDIGGLLCEDFIKKQYYEIPDCELAGYYLLKHKAKPDETSIRIERYKSNKTEEI